MYIDKNVYVSIEVYQFRQILTLKKELLHELF